jgi:hypothetical protein
MIPARHLLLQRLQYTPSATLQYSINIIKAVNLVQSFHGKNNLIVHWDTSAYDTCVPSLGYDTNFFLVAIF